jgi:hypothetical protein
MNFINTSDVTVKTLYTQPLSKKDSKFRKPNKQFKDRTQVVQVLRANQQAIDQQLNIITHAQRMIEIGEKKLLKLYRQEKKLFEILKKLELKGE